jgi:hypothetical protein
MQFVEYLKNLFAGQAMNVATNVLAALSLFIGQAVNFALPDPRFHSQVTAISGAIAFVLWTLGKEFLIREVPALESVLVEDLSKSEEVLPEEAA